MKWEKDMEETWKQENNPYNTYNPIGYQTNH